MVREEGASALARGVGPNVFRAVLMNASQLASYDFFKAELLKTKYFEDNIMCHFTASFAAVGFICRVFGLCTDIPHRELSLRLSALPLTCSRYVFIAFYISHSS
jgi:hypothetical protein